MRPVVISPMSLLGRELINVEMTEMGWEQAVSF